MPHRFVYKQLREGWRRGATFLSHRVLHLDDTPHRIALGVAIGFFVAWTPLLGGHMALALILCTLLRANKVAGVSFVWVCNPLTMGPIYYSSYRLGCALLPGAAGQSGRWNEVISRLFDESVPIWTRISQLGSLSWDIVLPLCVGCVIVGLIMAGLSYWVTFTSVTRYRRRMAAHPIVVAPAHPIVAVAASTPVPEPAGRAASRKGSCVG
jgi:uncharacterized protein